MEYVEQDRKTAILSLTFGQKMRIAWKLTKPRLIPYFLLFAGASLVLGVVYSIILGLSSAIFPVFLVFLLPMPIINIYFLIGLYSSIVRYMDGKEHKFQLSTVFEPFRRWKQILPVVLILLGISIVIWIPVMILSMIPLIGILANMAAVIIMFIVATAYFFYIAENMDKPTVDLVKTPLKLVASSIPRWMPATGAYLLTCIMPCVILATIAAGVFIASGIIPLDAAYTYDEYYDFNSVSGGALAASLLLLVLTCVIGYIGSIFSLFMFAIAYKQSLLDNEIKNLPPYGQGSAYQPPQNPQDPQNTQRQGQPPAN